MATIEKRISKQGAVSYLAKVRLVGFEDQAESFTSLAKAKRWAADTESGARNQRRFNGPSWISDPFRCRCWPILNSYLSKD